MLKYCMLPHKKMKLKTYASIKQSTEYIIFLIYASRIIFPINFLNNYHLHVVLNIRGSNLLWIPNAVKTFDSILLGFVGINVNMGRCELGALAFIWIVYSSLLTWICMCAMCACQCVLLWLTYWFKIVSEVIILILLSYIEPQVNRSHWWAIVFHKASVTSLWKFY